MAPRLATMSCYFATLSQWLMDVRCDHSWSCGSSADHPQVNAYVFLEETDYHSNQMAFSQDSLFRGYAHGWETQETTQASLACQQRDYSEDRHCVGVLLF